MRIGVFCIPRFRALDCPVGDCHDEYYNIPMLKMKVGLLVLMTLFFGGCGEKLRVSGRLLGRQSTPPN